MSKKPSSKPQRRKSMRNSYSSWEVVSLHATVVQCRISIWRAPYCLGTVARLANMPVSHHSCAGILVPYGTGYALKRTICAKIHGMLRTGRETAAFTRESASGTGVAVSMKCVSCRRRLAPRDEMNREWPAPVYARGAWKRKRHGVVGAEKWRVPYERAGGEQRQRK